MKIKIKVIANSSNQKVEEREGVLRVHLKSVPMKGKANSELLEVLAKHFGRKKSEISIVKGSRSNIKDIEIG